MNVNLFCILISFPRLLFFWMLFVSFALHLGYMLFPTVEAKVSETFSLNALTHN